MLNKNLLKLVIFGPQGAGKGTQAKKIAAHFDLAHICTGDLMREEIKKNSKLGESITQDVKRGEIKGLSKIATILLSNRLLKNDVKEKGYIIDGYPRNQEQLEILSKLTKLSKVIVLQVKKKFLIKRLVNRLVCQKCGANYNLVTNPPQKKGICDVCGGTVELRMDDTPQAITSRLKYHQKETKPLIAYYKKRGLVLEIDGNQSIEDVFEDIKSKLLF